MTVAARTSPTAPRSSRRLSWDVIRVVAIVFVVLGHTTGLASRLPGIEPYPVQVAIPFGTATLLVLSGYFIGPTIRRGSAGAWFRARLARLLPAYLVPCCWSTACRASPSSGSTAPPTRTACSGCCSPRRSCPRIGDRMRCPFGTYPISTICFCTCSCCTSGIRTPGTASTARTGPCRCRWRRSRQLRCCGAASSTGGCVPPWCCGRRWRCRRSPR